MPWAKVFRDDGKVEEFVVGEKGITNLFADQNDPSVLVVLTDNETVSYSGFPFIICRARRAVKDGE